VFSIIYIYSLYKVEIKDISINQLEDISLSGFTLGGDIEVHNKGIIAVKIKQITYSITLDDTNTQLASGLIQGASIPAKQTVSFPFSSRISWVPTAELAWNLITPGKTNATIKGDIHIVDLGFIEIKRSFEKKIDLEPYIVQFAEEQVEKTIDKVTETVKNTLDKIGDEIKSITGNLVKGIGDLLN